MYSELALSHSRTGLRWAGEMCSPHFSSSLDSYASFPRHAVVMFPVLSACRKPLEFSGAPENLGHSNTARHFNLGNAQDLRWEQEDCVWNHSEPLKQDPSVALGKSTHVPGSYHLMRTTHTWGGNPWARITVALPGILWLIMKVTIGEFSDTWGHNTVRVSVKCCGSFLCRPSNLEFIRRNSLVFIRDWPKERQRLNLTSFYKNNMKNPWLL